MRKIISIFVTLLLLGYFQFYAHAENGAIEKLKSIKPKDYPKQAIEFVVVYAAGGGMDVTARILGKYVEKYINNRIIVMNKTGGGGFVGHTYLATEAKNDGYSIGILSNSFWTDGLLKSKGKWSYKNMVPLAFINYDPITWIVSSEGSLKDKSLKDIINMSKQNPGQLKLSILPEMPYSWLAEDVENASGGKFIKVPFQGSVQGVLALLGGHVDIATSFLGEYRAHLEAGKVKIVGQTGTERHFFFRDVPTFNEVLGVNNITWEATRFAAVPKGVPSNRFIYLEGAIDAALHDSGCISDYEKSGIKIGLNYMNARQTSDWIEKRYQSSRAFFVRTGRISE